MTGGFPVRLLILTGLVIVLPGDPAKTFAQPLPGFSRQILHSLPPEPPLIPVPSTQIPPPGTGLPGLPPQTIPGQVIPGQMMPGSTIPGQGVPEPADPAAPQVRIRVRVAASAVPGRELQYRLLVENCSRAPAHHVMVRVPLPGNTRYIRATPEPSENQLELRWRLGTLEGCGEREILLVVVPTGEGDVRTCARVQMEYGQCVSTRIERAPIPPGPIQPPPVQPPPVQPPPVQPPPVQPPPVQPPPVQPAAKPELRFRVTGPAQALQYDVVPLQMEVVNVGQGVARDVAITAALPAPLDFSTSSPSPTSDNPLTWSLGTLQPGQTGRVRCQVIAKQTGAAVFAAEVKEASGLREEASAKINVGEAKLTIVKTGPTRRLLTSLATYQITVTNQGDMPATGVTIIDVIPDQLTFVSADQGGTLVGKEARWRLGTLEPGIRKTVQLVLRAREPGELINRATVRADRGLSAQAEVRTLFEGASGLTLEIDKTADPLEVGGKTTFTVRIINQGDGPATRIALKVIVPRELKILAQSGTTTGKQDGQLITFAPVATLPPRGDAKFQIEASGLSPGVVRLQVEITADQLTGGPLRGEESTTIYSDAPPGPP